MSRHFTTLFSNSLNLRTLVDKSVEDLVYVGIPSQDSQVIITAIAARHNERQSTDTNSQQLSSPTNTILPEAPT